MFCHKCGKQVNENVKFCQCCGTSLTAKPVRQKKQPKPAKKKKKSKGTIASFAILIVEALLICGVFAFFPIYERDNFGSYDDDDDYGGSSQHDLDEANENARLAYNAVSDYFDEKFHIEDEFAHGFYSGTIDVNDGILSDVLENVIDDGYIKVFHYDDRLQAIQWCDDESGDDTVGQYPDPIEKDDEINVEFGTIYNPADYININTIEDNYKYKEYESGNIEILEYKGNEKNVVIPEYIDGHKVVAINEDAFMERRDYRHGSVIESLTIPGTVEEIEAHTFSSLDELRSVKISKGVKIIGEGAFSDCGNLEEVDIPKSVEEIDDYAFWYCDSLETIKIPNSVEKIGHYAFARSDKIREVSYDKWYIFIFDPTIFVDSYIFYKCLVEAIPIGIFVITVIVILIVHGHKKRKLQKAGSSTAQAAPSVSAVQNITSSKSEEKVKCPQCSAENSPKSKFCTKCGYKMWQ